MFLFQPPPPTRYDLNFSLAGIPVRVHPLFWLIALLLGSSGDLVQVPIWVFAIFVSILIHELGHALAFGRYGQPSRIILHFMGGLTVPEPMSWGSGWASVSPSPMQQIIISLAGPFAGFFSAALVIAGVILMGGAIDIDMWLGFIPIPILAFLPVGGNIVGQFIALLLWVNVVWGLFNLLPVFPLDGGQVMRNIFVQYDPWGGVRKSLWVSVIASGIIVLAGLLRGNLFLALLFGFLAFQGYQSLYGRAGIR